MGTLSDVTQLITGDLGHFLGITAPLPNQPRRRFSWGRASYSGQVSEEREEGANVGKCNSTKIAGCDIRLTPLHSLVAFTPTSENIGDADDFCLDADSEHQCPNDGPRPLCDSNNA